MKPTFLIREWRNKGKNIVMHGPFYSLDECMDYAKRWIEPRKWEVKIKQLNTMR